MNKRFGFSVATGYSTQFSHQVGHTNTWRGVSTATNGAAFPHTTPGRPYLSAYQYTDAPKESARESLGLTLDFRLSAYDRISMSYQYSSFDGWTAARNMQFNPLQIVPGGPLTDLTRNVQRDSAGRPLDAQGRPVPITTDAVETSRLTFLPRGTDVEKEYLRFFPSLNVSYNVRENLIARAAISTSVGRPNFNQYAGAVTLPNTDNPPSSTNRISVNNAGIKPWTATSTKLRLEYYFPGVGQLTFGVFRRDYTDFFGNTVVPATPAFLALYALDPDEYSAYEVATQYNVPGTTRMQGWDGQLQAGPHVSSELGSGSPGVCQLQFPPHQGPEPRLHRIQRYSLQRILRRQLEPRPL